TNIQVYMDYPVHFITIQFATALPDNLEHLAAELIRIIPARLGIRFIVAPLTWGIMRDWSLGLSGRQPPGVRTWDRLRNDAILWVSLRDNGSSALPQP